MDSLNAFPSDASEALALLYVQTRDLSKADPEEIAAMYDDAYDRIRQKLKDIKQEKKWQGKIPTQQIMM